MVYREQESFFLKHINLCNRRNGIWGIRKGSLIIGATMASYMRRIYLPPSRNLCPYRVTVTDETVFKETKPISKEEITSQSAPWWNPVRKVINYTWDQDWHVTERIWMLVSRWQVATILSHGWKSSRIRGEIRGRGLIDTISIIEYRCRL